MHRTGNIVSAKAIQVLAGPAPGYSSVYAFYEPDARMIRMQGNSRGFARFPVYAECLILDIDGGDEQMKRVIPKLDAMGLGYQVYISGGKGYHIYIPHDPIYSPDLPYSHLKWVEITVSNATRACISMVESCRYPAGFISPQADANNSMNQRKE
jgi:hypothetical protein